MASLTIRLFLLDGTADGRIKCFIKGRTRIIFKIPRKDLAACKEREELNNGGVYFLLGETEIYVGQAASRKNGKGILGRLEEHNRSEKNFWTEAIVFTDKSFGATEISWLENKFCNMATNAARYKVTNGNDPSPGNITEGKEIVLEDHAEFAQLILNAIGYKIFEPLSKPAPPKKLDENDEEIFYFSRNVQRIGHIPDAKMKRTPTGYKVLAGSEISSYEIPKLSMSLKKRRHAAKVDENRRLLEDEEFSSAKLAAQFVIGNYAHLTDWQTREGVPLKNISQGGN